MKKFMIFLISIIFVSPTGYSKTLNGEVKYTNTQAQNEILKTSPPHLEQIVIKENFYDMNNLENTNAILQGYTSIKDRILGNFSDGTYAIKYLDNPYYIWYYNSNGILSHIEKQLSLEYPYKTYKYNTRGKLINMTLRVSENETFIFNPDGKLIAHWLNNNCFDSNGNIIMTRQIEK